MLFTNRHSKQSKNATHQLTNVTETHEKSLWKRIKCTKTHALVYVIPGSGGKIYTHTRTLDWFFQQICFSDQFRYLTSRTHIWLRSRPRTRAAVAASGQSECRPSCWGGRQSQATGAD